MPTKYSYAENKTHREEKHCRYSLKIIREYINTPFMSLIEIKFSETISPLFYEFEAMTIKSSSHFLTKLF